MKQTHSLLQYKLPLLPTSILKLFLKRMWIGHLLRHAPSCFWDSPSSPHTFTPSLIVHVQCCGCRELCRVFFWLVSVMVENMAKMSLKAEFKRRFLNVNALANRPMELLLKLLYSKSYKSYLFCENFKGCWYKVLVNLLSWPDCAFLPVAGINGNVT